jgi:hypothetical protein
MDEEWATVAMGGVRIGYIHTLSRQEASPPALVTNVFSESRLQRFGVGLAIRMSVEYRESPDGTLLSAASSTSGSGSEITSEARAVED